jgi:hypothetical protein
MNTPRLAITSLFSLLLIASCKQASQTGPESVTTTKPILTTTPLHNLNFDLDGDAKSDYLFEFTGWYTATIPPSYAWVLFVNALDSNQVQNSSLRGTLPIGEYVPISDTSGWNHYSQGLAASVNGSPWTGRFVKTTAQILGFRLSRQGSYYYGWVTLSIEDDGSLSIFDFAISKSADTPIRAGIHA